MATLYHEVWINAPTAKVYQAISTADEISTWWDKQTATETDQGVVLEHNPGPEHGVVKMKVLTWFRTSALNGSASARIPKRALLLPGRART